MQWHFLLSYALVAFALFYSFYKQLGIEKQIFTASIRAFLQLFLLGVFLSYIFSLQGIWHYALVLGVMLLFAAYTARQRSGGFVKALISISFASLIVLATLVALNIVSLRPNEFIPIGGMIVGNGLNIYTLFVERYKSEIRANQGVIQQYLALGLTQQIAIKDIEKTSLKAALIPIMNSLQTVGIIHIPGIMAGMIIAGADPLEAVLYQVVIMYMIVAVALLTSLFAMALLQKEGIKFD
ncbi:MAG: ABC transporter permease [Campylobacterota bacterium]